MKFLLRCTSSLWVLWLVSSQVHNAVAQAVSAESSSVSHAFQAVDLQVPEGFSVELVAGPPLVTHPTMGCFDDRGRLYVCNNSGVNLSNTELEAQLPNAIYRLVDHNHDGKFDTSTVFADKMTFPMGGAWANGSLYVASPPHIWRLTDTDDDGVADQREILVSKFGDTGNAASIHGCFNGPDGRIYWTDGYHGHEFKDETGKIVSKREGSYLFSCRVDGSDVRIHCGGGMDNPVEIDFTDAGDMLGTVNILYTRPRVDCLVHWLYGGAYPHRQKVLDEIQVTGDLLGPVHRFGHVAISGLMRYRSGGLYPRWQDDWFATFFNSGKVVRLSTEPQGSSFAVTQHEFLSSSNREFHPTDVLEDADGSLLVIDTGGWFYRGCPTSQFAKPDVLGGIYRIRSTTMPSVADPRGNLIAWDSLTDTALAEHLRDDRFCVRQRAMDACAARGATMIDVLRKLATVDDVRTRVNSVWVLSRLAKHHAASNNSLQAIQQSLADKHPEVRQVACAAMGRHAGEASSTWLIPLLKDPVPSVRREAATTLGKIGDNQSVPFLMAALRQPEIDRSEEHAIVFSLIEIGDHAAIRQALLNQEHPTAWRGGVIALDQIETGDLQFHEIAAGLQSPDPQTRAFVATIASRHPEWTSELTRVFRSWLSAAEGQQTESLETLLPIFLQQDEVAAMVGEFLQPEVDPAVRALVFRAIAQSSGVRCHATWIGPLQSQLGAASHAEVQSAVTAIAALSGSDFTQQLADLSDDEARPLPLRLDAMAALVRRTGSLKDESLSELMDLYLSSSSASASSRAARILGMAKLDNEQLRLIAPLMRHASAAELRDLLSAFSRGMEPATAKEFIQVLGTADAFLTLGEHEVSDLIKSFPRDLLDEANLLVDRLKLHQQQKLLRLEGLRNRLSEGDPVRGRAVFFSEKAKCATCHRVGEVGDRVGPELTTIGSNRSTNDLLESILFPSASIVRDYETYRAVTADGKVIIGLVTSETAEIIELQQANGEKVKLQVSDLETLARNPVSLMPSGLDAALSEGELLDVVRYLQSLNVAAKPAAGENAN